MRNFKYCQSQIEDSDKCESQCSHCKEYYKELEQAFNHEVKVMTDEQIKDGRSPAYRYIYRYIDFEKQEEKPLPLTSLRYQIINVGKVIVDIDLTKTKNR